MKQEMMPQLTPSSLVPQRAAGMRQGPGHLPCAWLMTGLGIWVAAVLLIGAVLTSYHQPIRPPQDSILSLVSTPREPALRPAADSVSPAGGGFRMLHVLSGSCGCSQRVMAHLLRRGAGKGVLEQILVVDDAGPYLPESAGMLDQLAAAGFQVTHLRASAVPAAVGLHGVPLLVLATADGVVRYKGGYGMNGDQDTAVLSRVSAGGVPRVLAVLGCAVGAELRRKADPFGLKYANP